MLTCTATNPTLGQTASAEKRLLLQCKIDSLNISKDKDNGKDKDKHIEIHNAATNPTFDETFP